MTALILIIALLPAIILHEIAHGYIAYKFGDPTAKNQGRITLNPLAHIDWIGSLLIPGLLIITGAPFLMGWAKPVPINPNYFKHPLRDMMWVAIAGPLTNATLATLASLILHITPNQPILLTAILIETIKINCVLGIFNLFPIPPLDGSRILMYLAPQAIQHFLLKIEPYGFAILFLLLYLGLFDMILPRLVIPLIRQLI